MQKLGDIQKLRAFAILMVLFGHTPLALPGVLLHGYTGVSLFFVISGYVVTLGFIRRPPATAPFFSRRTQSYLGGFYVRRAFRIFPVMVFWVAFSIAIVEIIIRLGGTPVWNAHWWGVEVMWLLSGAFNYFFANSHAGALFGHFWSLAVEMHFYILLPVLLLAFRKRSQRIALCLAAVVIISTLLRLMTPLDLIGFLTHTQADALFMGVLLCVLFAGRGSAEGPEVVTRRRLPQVVKNVIFLSLAAVLFIVPSQLDGNWSPIYKYPLYTLIATLMVFLAQRETGWVLGGMPRLGGFMAYVGDRSYSLYLCHPILWLGVYTFALSRYGSVLPEWLKTGSLGVALQAAFLFLVALGVADLSYRFIEIPFIAMGKGLVKRVSNPVESQVSDPTASPVLSGTPQMETPGVE